MNRSRRRPAVLAAVIALLALAGGCAETAPPTVAPSHQGDVATHTATPSAKVTASPAATAGLETAPSPRPSDAVSLADPDSVEPASAFGPASLLRWTELYLDAPSFLAGEVVGLHVSSPGGSFTVRVTRLGAKSTVVFKGGRFPGADERRHVSFDARTRTARPSWPVRDSLQTGTYLPGVYDVSATSRSGTGHALLIIRSPRFDPTKAAFVVPVLDYQAYNAWGGADFYTKPDPNGRAYTVTLQRPYLLKAGLGLFPIRDRYLLTFVEQALKSSLSYTTDYDLSVRPPAVAPRTLIIPQHMEYVPVSLRDWLDQRVLSVGDMNLVSFGANHAYWQVHLDATPASSGGFPTEMTCTKGHDPAPIATSALATVRWREAPVNRPEGALFGSMYAGILGDGHVARFDATISTAGVLPSLFDGTGWKAGTVVHGILTGEGDSLFPLAPSEGPAVPVLMGVVGTPGADRPTIEVGASVRTTPAGSRIFAAGTFGWADAFHRDNGVSPASWRRFNRNILEWVMEKR